MAKMGPFALAFTSTGRYLKSVTLPVYLLHPTRNSINKLRLFCYIFTHERQFGWRPSTFIFNVRICDDMPLEATFSHNLCDIRGYHVWSWGYRTIWNPNFGWTLSIRTRLVQIHYRQIICSRIYYRFATEILSVAVCSRYISVPNL